MEPSPASRCNLYLHRAQIFQKRQIEQMQNSAHLRGTGSSNTKGLWLFWVTWTGTAWTTALQSTDA